MTECGNRLHGKEGVDGSSPSEGSAKSPLRSVFRMCSVGLEGVGFANSGGRIWQVCCGGTVFRQPQAQRRRDLRSDARGELTGDEFDRADVFAAVA